MTGLTRPCRIPNACYPTRAPSILIRSPVIDPASLSHVLDLACGPGAWLCNLAERFPHLHATGLLLSDLLLPHACRLRDELSLSPARLTVVAHDPFPLLSPPLCQPVSFDLISLPLRLAHFHPENYPRLVRLCKRLCKPGGFILWTEAAFPHTTSVAREEWGSWVQEILRNERRAFTPGYMLGITTYPRYCLEAVDCSILFDQSYALEVSAGYPGNQLLQEEAQRVWLALKPWIVTHNRKHVTVSVYEYLYKLEEALEGIRGRYFCGVCSLRTVVGRKPIEDDDSQ